MAETGKLIVIAGIDGSGKTEQTKRLIQRLRDEGHAAAEEEFPRYEESFFGRTVGRYLRGELGPTSDIDPRLASVLYAGDRWQAKGRMEAALSRGEVLVCNRYVSANLAHQGGKIAGQEDREAFFEWVEELEYEVFSIPRPDQTIFLRVPPDVAAGLVEGRGARAYLRDGKKDGHEADHSHLANAHAVYEHLSGTRPKWSRVECVRDGQLLSVEEVSALVWEVVRPVLPG